MKIKLVGQSVLIKRDTIDKQTQSGIFLGDVEQNLDTGIVTHVGLDLSQSEIGSRVKFKEAYSEPIEVNGIEYLFFRELEPSIYFYIEDEDKEQT